MARRQHDTQTAAHAVYQQQPRTEIDMTYDYDTDAPAVDWQESQDEAVACAQIERDQAQHEAVEPAPF